MALLLPALGVICLPCHAGPDTLLASSLARVPLAWQGRENVNQCEHRDGDEVCVGIELSTGRLVVAKPPAIFVEKGAGELGPLPEVL